MPEVPVCTVCNFQFESNELLTEHMKSHDKKPKKTRTTKFSCEHCSEVLPTSIKYKEHVSEVHSVPSTEIKPFKCGECDKRFSTSAGRVCHYQTHLGARNKICSYCGKGFVSSSYLINHEKLHHSDNSYKCDECDEAFNTSKKLRTHQAAVHRDRTTYRHICELCGKRFSEKSFLNVHIRRHIGDKRFTCETCGKAFVTKEDMKKHAMLHDENAVRSFPCEHCEDKVYGRKRSLDLHLARVHGVGNAKESVRKKRHFCEVCDMGFCFRKQLEKHMCSHTGIRPHACEFCDRRFSDGSYLRGHLRSAHGIGDEKE